MLHAVKVLACTLLHFFNHQIIVHVVFLYLNSSANVKEYLEEYFAQSQRALRGSVDQNLYLLCIQCFEV